MRFVGLLIFIAWSNAATGAWQYSTDADPMGGQVKTATVQSNNAIEFNSPYRGPQKAVLHIRVHPRYGRNVIFTISRGQFICGVSDCQLTVRFDEKPAVRFTAAAPADHSSTALFIQDYGRFLREARSAKVVRIEASFYQQGTRVLEFGIAGLDFDAQYKPPAKSDADKKMDAFRARGELYKKCSSEAARSGLSQGDRAAFMDTCRNTRATK